jgi:hypothetical protein
MYICIYVYVCICIYVYMYLCIYIYVHTHRNYVMALFIHIQKCTEEAQRRSLPAIADGAIA